MSDIASFLLSNQIPDDQQEEETDSNLPITFKDAVVLNTDWTIETLNSQIGKGNIDLQPEFQRRSAWDATRKSRLIESIIVAMPVPNIVLAENREHRGRFIVIDGKQRLIAISDFLNEKYRLKGLDIRQELNGLAFSKLPDEDREYLENATLRSTVIRNWPDQNFLYAIFFRLNSGSLPLSPQELRKALVGGQLLRSIEDYLVASEPAKFLFGGALDKRMRDSELVLRFLAFDRNLTSYQGNFRLLLDQTTRYYEADWSNRGGEASRGFDRLDRALKFSFDIFGDNAFKKWLGDRYERVINRAIFDCIVRYFCEEHIVRVAENRRTDIVQTFHAVCMEQEFRDSIERTTKSVPATFYRINRWGAKLAEQLGMAFDVDSSRII